MRLREIDLRTMIFSTRCLAYPIFWDNVNGCGPVPGLQMSKVGKIAQARAVKATMPASCLGAAFALRRFSPAAIRMAAGH